MSTIEYNPFPEVTDVTPSWINSGVCYSTAVYADESVARKVAEAVRETGRTVNGGFLHGQPLGQVHGGYTLKDGREGWGVTF